MASPVHPFIFFYFSFFLLCKSERSQGVCRSAADVRPERSRSTPVNAGARERSRRVGGRSRKG